jgi:Carboxypeptidase regulatory-like domain/TonB dependent receptor
MRVIRSRHTAWLAAGTLSILLLTCLPLGAQDILGAITGTVKDSSGAIVADAIVKAHSIATNQEITEHSNGDGFYSLLNLPIGMYEVTISKTGFQTESHTQVLVSGNRTATVDGNLQVATASTTVNVIETTPLMNQADTTNGYVVDALTIANTPLGTGSFTQLAVMAPGLHADFLGGSGSNSGLGNQAIFANGQRDTSNSFSMNGVDTNNLFNGNSTSQVGENRFVLNTGENFPAGGGVQTATSVFGAIGQALPTPPMEAIQEISVNAAMYDASQGAHSGAHIGVITKSGTNGLHGEIYEYFQNSDMNAAPFFYNASPAFIAKNPFQARNQFGATLGGPIKKDKLFYFLSYQGMRNADAADSTQTLTVPQGLTNDRSLAGLASMYNATTGKTIAQSAINPVTQTLMSATLPNGQFLIPTPTITNSAQAVALGYNAVVQGPNATSSVNQGIANIDYLLSNNDRMTGRYFAQNDPTSTPFGAVGGTLGFPQTLSAGSQVASIENTLVLTPNLTWVQHVGFTRLQAYSNTGQAFTPQQMGINLLGVKSFPQIEIGDFDTHLGGATEFGNSVSFGNAGMYQNQWEYGTTMNWVKGRHTISVGAQWDHTQLNIINNATESAKLDFKSLLTFLEGTVRTGIYSSLFDGLASADRYYRSDTIGAFINDKWKVRSNLTVTLGLRWDDDGALSEKYGRLADFNSKLYSYNLATDTISGSGLEFAGNNPTFATSGANSTLMNKPQWGFAPRVGVAWSPTSKLTVRAGYGMYYDRGEYFTEFSPSAGGGFNGPFAVTLAPPFNAPVFAAGGATFATPFGTTTPPPPAGSPAAFLGQLPNMAETTSGAYPGGNKYGPFLFGGYDINNKLPYSENWTLDLQYQLSNTWLFSAGYVGNHGVHLVLPIPFNQPGIATASNPINGQTASYGGVSPLNLDNEPIFTPEFSGNAPLRVPYIGYDMNSVLYKGEGISNYDALQLQVRKRLSFGLTLTGAYTWSHALDEQSGLGIFFTGNNPVTPRSSYGNADFDQTHVFLLNYSYTIPKFNTSKGLGYLVNGWTIAGQTVAQSGQPYSVYDYSGSVGSIYYGTNIYIANPIVPLLPGVTVKQAQLQGTTGVNAGKPVLNVADFYPQFIQPGTYGVPACDSSGCDSYESLFSSTGRNIFRGPFQVRFDLGLAKEFTIHEKYRLRFNAMAFNLFNHPDFDTPNNDVTYFADFSAPPLAVPEGSLGYIQHTLGSSRFLQLALHLSF